MARQKSLENITEEGKKYKVYNDKRKTYQVALTCHAEK